MHKKATGNEVSDTDSLVEDCQGKKKCVYCHPTDPNFLALTLIFYMYGTFLLKNYIEALFLPSVFQCLYV